MSLSLRSVLLAALCGAPVAAQGADVATQAFGVAMVDGEVRAMGPDFAARLHGRGIEFVPALGSAADRTHALRFTLRSLRRGSTVVWQRDDGECQPVVTGNTVRYEHGPLTEVYDVRRAGIEQSFVFAERPAGQGDLVVVGDLTSDLPLCSTDARGALHFGIDGLGGVHFGAVTGVDHNGATAAGRTRLAGSQIELALPAAFVDGAAYPLVLDPLIGAVIAVGNQPGGSDVNPDVAYDTTTGRYYVVWEVALSSTLHEVRGQLVANNGTLVFGPALIGSGQPNPTSGTLSPTVAIVRASGRFLASWIDYVPAGPGPGSQPNRRLRCRAVSASTGSQSALVDVSQYGGQIQWGQLAAGGDSRPAGGPFQVRDRALLVSYRYIGGFGATYSIVATSVQVPSSGDPVLFAEWSLATGNWNPAAGPTVALLQPAISRHAGATGYWGVAYTRGVDIVGVDEVVLTQANAATAVCGPALTLAAGGGIGSVANPAVATRDGSEFLVAWEAPLANTIRVRKATWSGSCASGAWNVGTTETPIALGGTQTQPALDFAQSKYLLAWIRDPGGINLPMAYVKGLDPATCLPCGVDTVAEPTVAVQSAPALAARQSGGDATSDEALLVWSDATIRARRVEAVGTGAVANLGGACGGPPGSDVPGYTGAPVIGEATFALSLQSPSAPVLALVIGLSNVSIPCGPCVLVPNTDILMTGGGPHPLPLPCDLSYLGVQFWAQWLLLAPGGCPILPDFALSSALQFTIGE